MKFIKILLAIVVLIGVASPYFAGRVLERDFNKFIARLNEESKQEYTVVGKFTRGYFNSTATTEITFKDSYVAIQLAHLIKHGPVIFNFNGWFSPSTYIPRGYKLGVISTKLSGKAQEFISSIYGGKQGYEFITALSMHGDIDSTITTEAFKTVIDKGELNWQGSTAEFNTNRDLEEVKFSFAIPNISYTEGVAPGLKQALQIAGIKIDCDVAVKTEQTLFKLAVASVKLSTNDKDDVNLQDYALTVDKKVANNMLDLDISKKFAKLTLEQDVYGPFDFDLKLNNWNAKVMRELMMQSSQQAPSMTQPAAQTSLSQAIVVPAQQPEASAHVNVPDQSVLDLLANKLGIDLDFKFVTPDGEVLAKVKADMGGPGITAVTADQILPTVNATENFVVAKKIVFKGMNQFAVNQIKQYEMAYYMMNQTSTVTNPYTMTPEVMQQTINSWITNVITQLTTQNFIVVKGDNIVIDMTYVNKVMTFNGAVKTADDISNLKSLLAVVPPPVAPTAPAATVPATPSTAPIVPVPASQPTSGVVNSAPSSPQLPATVQ